MSDITIQNKRNRGQNLIIVEGNHEKNVLFQLIFRCFPEMKINMDDIWIYGTNLYVLYQDIENEYGEDWTEVDVDLPFVISKKNHSDRLRYKDEFVNIILVFDYERHDIRFSEQKILEMQNYFMDAADAGRLYINYPMIESYQHLTSVQDAQYSERKIPAAMQPGKKYKDLVKEQTFIKKFIDFPDKVKKSLIHGFGICDALLQEQCMEEMLNISALDNLEANILEILQGKLNEEAFKKAKNYFPILLSNTEYIRKGVSYWKYMREIFQQIIIQNICKANRIQKGIYRIEENEYRRYFEELDFTEILKKQNESSRDFVNGYIWVLNTCIFFIAEYNFNLVMNT